MSTKRNVIVEYLSEYLKAKDFEDYCHNGLQIEGKENISKIVAGVSLSQRLIKEAIKKKADMLIVHHGLFLNDVPSPLQLKGLIKERVKMILRDNISLIGYHLPLDAHPKIGNNISLARLFGIKKCKPVNVGFAGKLDREIDFVDFVKLVDRKLGVKSFVLSYGKRKVKRVAVISGGSSPDFEEVFNAGADVFVGGDIRESEVRKMEEVGINYINAGHYNTEKLGIQNLGKLIEKKFKIRAEFVDVPNEV